MVGVMSRDSSGRSKCGETFHRLPRIRQHADRFPVVTHQRADHDPALVRRERHAVADGKRQQGHVRPQRVKGPRALDDAPVQVDPFGFGQAIDIDGHGSVSTMGVPEALGERA
jgi:hypothetical protein